MSILHKIKFVTKLGGKFDPVWKIVKNMKNQKKNFGKRHQKIRCMVDKKKCGFSSRHLFGFEFLWKLNTVFPHATVFRSINVLKSV